VGLELGPLSLISTFEELLGRKKKEERKKRKKRRRAYLYKGKLCQLKADSMPVFM
jgi:hypothetical protein